MEKYRLTDAQIRQYVGQSLFARGQAYYTSGRVKRVVLNTKDNSVTATVKGSRNYHITVTLRTSATSQSIAQSSCTCAVGRACKHVAAALLKVREQYTQNIPEATIMTPQKQWRQTLGVLTNDVAPVSAIAENKKKGIVGVLFELQHTVQASSGYYGPKVTKPAAKGRIKLGLRPIIPGANGNWINNGLTWPNLTGYSRQPFANEAHHKWIKELWAMYCVASENNYYYSDSGKWLYLDDFPSSNVWAFLEQGHKLGIPFVQANRNQTPLELSAIPFVPTVNIVTRGASMQVTTELHYDGQKVLFKQLHFFGEPAVGVYVWQEQASLPLKEVPLILAPLSTAVDQALQQEITKKSSVAIPSSEIADFKQHYYPVLAQRFAIVTDGKTLLPELGTPQLHITVQSVSAASLDIALQWNYTAGGQIYTLPLRPSMKRPDPIIRSESEEQRILSTFLAIMNDQHAFFAAESGTLQEKVALTGMAAVSFALVQLPKLRTRHPDMLVEIEGELPSYEEFAEEPLVQVGTAQSANETDWFDLNVSLKLGEHEVPMEQLLIALASNEPYLVLENGIFFRLDHPKLLQLKKMIDEARGLQETEGKSLRLSKFQAGLWEELAALGVVTEQAAAWRDSLRGLLNIASIPKTTVPAELKATLRPYQAEGFSWLAFLYEHRLGGILADDMGLGKTLQAIALLLYVRAHTAVSKRRPSLVVAPTSVAANWMAELARFAPKLKVAYCQQTTAKAGKTLASLTKGIDVVVTSYAICRFDEEQYLAQQWDVIVLDEAQFVKNHQSKGYQVVRRLAAQFKIVLTGTPLENNLLELWALLSIAAPGLFPNPKQFSDFYQKPIERQSNNELLGQLRRRVRPLMLRRTKDQVVKDLPAKTEQVIELELNHDHRNVYDLYLQRERQRVLGLLGDFDKNRFAILKAITTLRQLSLDPKLVDAEKYRDVSSTKLDGLLEQLDEVVGEGHRALIFSQFTSFLASVRTALDERQMAYLYLDGATKKRGVLLETFKTSSIPLFLISLKAGGFGLNLTEADYCFLLDPWWNPAVEQQAIDRTHRIGQTKPVMVYRLIAKGTIEEKVMALKKRKAKLFSSVLDEGELFSSTITAADIRSLFDE